MNRSIKSLLIVIAMLFSVTAYAHPGHGTFNGHEIWHYVTSPVHMGIALGIVVVLFAGYKLFKRQSKTSK